MRTVPSRVVVSRPLAVGLCAIVVAMACTVVACDQVQVVGADAASLQVVPATLTVEIGETTPLDVVVRDANGVALGGQTVLWASSNPSIASVDTEGNITAVSVGNVVVTARSGTASGTCQVVVQTLPGFSLDRSEVSLAGATGASAGPETVLVSGTGTNPATGLATSTSYGDQGSGWLQASLSSTSSPASLQISASTMGLNPGVYEADLTVSADRVPSRNVDVTLTVSARPTIDLSPTSVSLSATAGSTTPASQTIAVTNLGGDSIGGLQASVIYGPGQPGNWLGAVLSSTSAPAQLTLTGSASTLLQGTYTATVRISSPDAVNSPQTVSVTFTVGP